MTANGALAKPAEPEPELKRSRIPVVALAVAVVLAGLGGWFLVKASAATPSNTALTAAGPTAELTGQVRDALEKVFSYRFDDPATTERAAGEVLGGDAVGQYGTLFEQVRQQAPAQRLSLRSKVVRIGVTRLEGDRAELLVFLDQVSTRGDTKAENAGAAQVSVSAQRVDGRWRVTGLRPR